MTSIIGYAVFFLVILPGFSMEAFFWVIGRSTRPHELLEMFRSAVQALTGVTSPFKMGLMLAVVAGVFLIRRARQNAAIAVAR